LTTRRPRDSVPSRVSRQQYDATEQLQALAARRIGARELLEAVVARADRLNPQINAVVSRAPGRPGAAARRINTPCPR